MSEQTVEPAVAAAEPASSGSDFFSAIEAAFASADAAMATPEPQEPAPTPEPAPANEEPAPAEATPDTVPDLAEKPESTLPIDEEPVAQEKPEEFDGLTGKAGRRFKQLKAELKQTTSELETLRQELAAREQALQEFQAANAGTEDLRKQLESYETLVSITKLEAHPVYQREVQEPMAQIVETAEAIAERYGIDPDEIIEALAFDRDKQDETFETLLTGVKERDKLAIYALAEQVPLIVARRNELAENAQAALAELEQLDQAQQQQQLAEQFEARRKAADDVRNKLVQKLPFLASIEDLKVDAISKRAGETDFETLDTHNKVYAKIAGDLLPTLAREFVALRNELEEAIDELESLKKAEPKAGPGAAASAAAPARAPGSFLDAINAALGG